MAVKAIPDGYHSLTPYLIVSGAAKAIDYYQKALGATVVMRMDGPDGTVGHAEMKVGDSIFMLADEHPQMGFRSPTTLGGAGVSLMIYLEDVDAVFDRAIQEGGKSLRPVQNQFYGDRSGTLEDPFGHVWTLSTHIEDVPPEEMEKRAAEAMK